MTSTEEPLRPLALEPAPNAGTWSEVPKRPNDVSVAEFIHRLSLFLRSRLPRTRTSARLDIPAAIGATDAEIARLARSGPTVSDRDAAVARLLPQY